MTSSPSYLIGKLYTWVPTSVLERYELIAPNNSAIATFPLDTSGGWFGHRRKKAKALVPSGTLFPDGAIFLCREGEDITISAVEQGPRLATYKCEWSQLVFPDKRVFWWGQPNFWATEKLPDQVKAYNNLNCTGVNRFLHVTRAYLTQKAWTDQTGTTVYVQFSDWTRKSDVVIYPPAAEIPELSILLVLGLDNILFGRREGTIERGNLAGTVFGLHH
jgi:hypothetical protein